MSKLKKSLFIFISILFLYLFSELISYSLFKIFKYDKELKLYSQKREGNLKYRYFEKVKLALPLPDTEIVHYTKEFTDRFFTKDILNLGFGFFDDGIDSDRKIFSVAIGDSFTRGVGSGDNLKNGWVELVENNIKYLDIINLGNLGRGVVDQKYAYDLIKNKIKHEVIIYNFFTGGDYYENATDNSAAYYLNKSIEEKNLSSGQINKLIKNLQIYHGYDPSLEYLLNTNYKSYSLWLLIKVSLIIKIDNFLPNNFLPSIYTKPYKNFNEYNRTRMGLVPDNVYDLAQNVWESSSVLKIQGKTFQIKKIYEDKEVADLIVDNSITQIKNFISQAKNENKYFFLIIHPSQNDVFLPLINDTKIKVDYTYLRNRIKDNLKDFAPVLDLTVPIQNEIKNNNDLKIFWDEDGHYTPLGYKIVSKSITKFLDQHLKK